MTEIAQETRTAVLERRFDAELTAGAGRTIDARIVPYGVTAEVSDGGPRYREEWVAGCFDDQVTHAGRGDRLKVLLNFEHRAGIGDVVGQAVEIRSEPDGLHGSFDVLETQDGDKALALVRAGILDGVSLEAYPRKSVRGADGVVRRFAAHLRNVALCRDPAFADAQVLAVRTEPEVMFDEDLLPTEMDAEIVERCRRLGIALPQRYEAHPAEGTPAQAGTPMDGTRHPDPATSEVDPTWVQRRASSGSPG